MTTFAIFYGTSDMTAIENAANNPGLSPSEKQTALAYWNGGLRNWHTAPTAPAAQSCVTIPFQLTKLSPTQTITQNPDGSWLLCDSDIKVVVVSGSTLSKQGLIDFLNLIGNKYPTLLFMTAIGKDLLHTAVEPWP